MLLLNYFTIPLVYRTHFINKLGDVFVCWHKNIYIESERGGEKERENSLKANLNFGIGFV